MRKSTLLLLSSVILLFSCGRDPVDTPPKIVDIIIDPPTELINSTITGAIFDERGLPLADVEIKLSEVTTTTNGAGAFLFENVPVYADGTKITASKAGFFQGSRKFYPIENETNQIRIQLIQIATAEDISSRNGGRVYFEEAYVDFPEGFYITEDGSPYNGAVTVEGKWLDPTLENSHYQMPGALIGLTADQQLRTLIPYGLIKINTTSDAGLAIRLPEDEKATIHLPVPPALRHSAPEILPLWHYDEKNAIWIESSSAQLENNFYVGEVDMMSFWNVTLPISEVTVSGNIKTLDKTINDAKVKLSSANSGYLHYTYTTEQGHIHAKMPQNETITIEIFESCNNASHSVKFETGSENIENMEFTLAALADNISISGTAQNCSGQNISEALIYESFRNKKTLHYADLSGNFSLPHSSCMAENIAITVIDQQQNQASDTYEVNFNSMINLGNIPTCNNISGSHLIDHDELLWDGSIVPDTELSWIIRRIVGATTQIIISPTFIDRNTGHEYYSGAFVLDEGSSQAQYRLELDSGSLKISGICEVQVDNQGGPTTYRFTDNNVEVSNSLNSLNFDLVYYD